MNQLFRFSLSRFTIVTGDGDIDTFWYKGTAQLFKAVNHIIGNIHRISTRLLSDSNSDGWGANI